jgi:hypothetical protein
MQTVRKLKGTAQQIGFFSRVGPQPIAGILGTGKQSTQPPWHLKTEAIQVETSI